MARKREGLSPRHRRILAFLEQFINDMGYPPSIREIGLGTQITSTSLVNYYLIQLEEMEYITRGSNVSRGINILKTAKGAPYNYPMRTNLRLSEQVLNIPMVGNIVAGEPMPVPASDFNYYDPESAVEVARSLLPADGLDQLYALKVHGDSMIDAMVNDGDIVVMKKTNQARNGEMLAVWLNDRDETTLKYFYLENGQVRLQPANPAMQAIMIRDPRTVEIQGKVVLVLRQLQQRV